MLSFLRETFTKWRADNASGMAAALAYNTLFSIVPIIVIFIGILGSIIGRGLARNQIALQTTALFGSNVSGFLIGLADSTHFFSRNIFFGIFSLLITLFAAISLFSQLKWSLDIIWKAAPRTKEKTFWKRVLPDIALFIMMAIVGLILLAFSLLSSLMAFFAVRFHYFLPLRFDLFLADTLVFLLMSSILFMALYRFLPNVKLKWRNIRAGAIVTSLFFTLGRMAIALYISHASTVSSYGAAGTVIALLLWVYYSAQIFYFGAEFTYVYSKNKNF